MIILYPLYSFYKFKKPAFTFECSTFEIYTEGCSKVGILTRRLLKIFRLERVTIANGQGTSEDKNFDAKPTPSKTNF